MYFVNISTPLLRRLVIFLVFATLGFFGFGAATPEAFGESIVETVYFGECTSSPCGYAHQCYLDPNGAPGRILVDWSFSEHGRLMHNNLPGSPIEDRFYSRSVNTNIPAGDYKITAQSFDSHPNRSSEEPQLDESFRLQLWGGLDAHGGLVATTNRTTDLNDSYDVVGQFDVIENNFTIGQLVRSVRGMHVFPDTLEQVRRWDSVRVTCAAFDPVPADDEVPDPTVDLTADLLLVAPGESVVLAWESVNAETCTAPWTNSNATSGSQSLVVNTTATYEIVCTNSEGVPVSDQVTISVNQLAPTVTLTVDPDSVDDEGEVELTWVVANAEVCYASNGWSGTRAATNGTHTAEEYVTSSTEFVITCVNSSGSATDSAQVVFTTSPIDPEDPVDPGDPTPDPIGVTLISSIPNGNEIPQDGVPGTLTWTVTGSPDSCVANGNWTGPKSVVTSSEDLLVTPGTYTIVCSKSDQPDAIASVMFNDLSGTMKLTANPTVVRQGNTTQLEWAADPSLTCSILANGLLIPGPAYSGLIGGGGVPVTSPAINAETVFALSCEGIPAEATARVRVLPFIHES